MKEQNDLNITNFNKKNLKITVKINFRIESYNYFIVLVTETLRMERRADSASEGSLHLLGCSLGSSQCHLKCTIKKTSKVAF